MLKNNVRGVKRRSYQVNKYVNASGFGLKLHRCAHLPNTNYKLTHGINFKR